MTHAENLLQGTVNLGSHANNFMATIRRDVISRSSRQVNIYLQDYFNKRPPNIPAPQSHISTYTWEEVERNALLEFSLNEWKIVKLTSVNITDFSMAILKLLSEADTLFCWTAELLRRIPYRADENWLKDRIATYDHLITYNRHIVYWFRHEIEKHPTRSCFQLLQDVVLAGSSKFTQSYPLNSAAIFPILIGCMGKNRYGITLGVQDSCAISYRTSVLISCTHGNSKQKCEDELDHPSIAWVPSMDEPQLAVHGTSLENWGLIVKDRFMKSMGRTDIHFTVYRPGMLIKEMPQLLKKGIFLIIDPGTLCHHDGFTVVQNLNDVIKVEGGPKGMNINFLITAIDGQGNYADLSNPRFRAPRIPEQYEPLLRDFVQQLQNPAAPYFNDSYGTTGDKARIEKARAEALAEGYKDIARTLSLTEASGPQLPQLMDQDAPVDKHDFKDYNTNPRLEALTDRVQQADPLVEALVTLYKTVEEEPSRKRPRLTSVSVQNAIGDAPDTRIMSYDNADYESGSDGAETYVSDTPVMIWSNERLQAFETIYEETAQDLTDHYTEVTLEECRVIVQAFAFLKKLPLYKKPCRAARILAMNALAAMKVCENY